MSYVNEPIAVIGTGCRFPGASTSPSKLWELMKSPRDVGSKIDRFNADGFYHKDGSHHGTSNVLNSYLIDEDTRQFDAQFFNIPGSEADGIDPQQRVLMEVVYEALEASGHKIEELSGTQTAVYVGLMCNDYAHITYHDLESIPKYAATGTAASILSNRISYYFNWTGPSMTIDTACSSSLIATHQAVETLRNGTSNVAVAAGANLIFGPTNYVAESNVSMLSPTGRSRMWDNKADGYARGEGVAAVILKRLSDAIADGDTIDCVIRETGVNQDGRTPGITMPSSTAQAQLIRQTYAKAGLDLVKDRCQYFEAHGTGTKAGDPQEAGAIYRAFFGENASEDPNDKLYVGSIKTIIGHTEGTAGLAGLIRASLAMKHGFIPPNMHFDELNPDVEPYYGKLEIVKAAQPWPTLPAGVPKRASVNSFGFGGANAHAIIESYEPATAVAEVATRDTTSPVPFLFSANSEKALSAQIEKYLAFLDEVDVENTNIRDLAWTLSRRSAFPIRVPVSALTLDTLRSKLNAAMEAKKSDGTALGVRPSHKATKILGVFTGQGAQWARMGYKLIETSPFAESLIKALDETLQALPEQDRPDWTLQGELAKPADESRIMEGTYSQPLCAALQIVLVELLKQAGVTFDVVVGHSSGEIGAAFAAGFLSARDAIRIAYYRGLYGKLAGAPGDVSGSMMAVGTSMEDARELAELPTMKRHGRFNVAASNSSASVTVSGDEKAIERAKFIFEDESKFVRQLKVDTAYHSHHMEPCSEPYMDAMARNKVAACDPNPSCKWYSSVLGGDLVTGDMKEQLAGSYWRDNLLQPVLFSQALEAAVKAEGAPALALEVGPHPALKGPASLVIEEAVGSMVPYSGVLGRKSDDVEAFSDAIGAVWANVGTTDLNYGALDGAFVSDPLDKPKFLRTTPAYSWDHNQVFWAESRLSKAMRMRSTPPHELLGNRIDSGENEMRWRNFLKPTEMPWTRGHSIQGQTIFPGAGFASMAIEASKGFADDFGEQIELVELEDLKIHRALGFMDEQVGVEIVVSLSNILHDDTSGLVTFDYTCSAVPSKDAPLATHATARVKLTLGLGTADTLPAREPRSEADKMTDVDPEIFYNSLAKLGYNYDGMFKTVTYMNRRTMTSSGTIHTASEDGYKPDLIVHPAPLDVAFQGLFGAIGAPGDGQLWTLMVPTIIRSIKVNPSTCKTGCVDTDLSFDANVEVDRSNLDIAGDIDVFDENGNAIMQIEGLSVTPVTQITAKDDGQKFSKIFWDTERNDATRSFKKFWEQDSENVEKAEFFERVCFSYMKQLHDSIKPEDIQDAEPQNRKYLAWATSVVNAVAEGSHPTIKKEWLSDSRESLESQLNDYAMEDEAFQTVMTLGENLVSLVRGETSVEDVFGDANALSNVQTYGTSEYTDFLGDLVGQLGHKAKQMDILEINAGAGAATEAILNRVGYHVGSYTYTDLTNDLFEEAQELFKEHDSRFGYRAFDLEKDLEEQGFREESYDLIVASRGLHASKSIDETLTNARKLLKAGGFLVLLETTETGVVHSSFFGGLSPSWWVTEEENDERVEQPLLAKKDWDSALKKAGFSGVDTATPETGLSAVPFTLMLTQAVDTQMQLIREPLNLDNEGSIKVPKLLVISGETEATARIQEEVLELLKPFTTEVEIVAKVEDLKAEQFEPKQLVISFMELDHNIFNPFTAERWSAIQLLSEKALNILWMTRGVSGDNAFANMMVGVSRALVHEKPDLRISLLDFATNEPIDTKYIASTLLRKVVSQNWKNWAETYVTSWVLEREIRAVGGEKWIPRMAPCDGLDQQYNASRRKVHNKVSLKDTVLSLDSNKGVTELHQVKKAHWEVEERTNLVEIETLRTTLAALAVPSVGSVHLLVGKVVGEDQTVLALTETVQSKISIPENQVLRVDVPEDQTQELLVAATNFLLGNYLVSQTTKNTSLLVHEPTDALTVALTDLSRSRNIAVGLTTSDPLRQSNDVQINFVHPAAHRRKIKSILPAKLSTYAYFTGEHESARSGAHLEAHLPSWVKRVSSDKFLGERADLESSADILNLLTQAETFYKDHSDLDTTEHVEELTLADITSYQQDKSHFKIETLDMSPEQEFATSTLRTPEDVVKFRGDKTYWLAGLTGDLGLSLTRWLISRGARHIVLTSRNPKIDAAWLDAMNANATVKALPMDITNMESVQKTYNTILETMPPVAGVCNGAMVLHDGLVANQSYEDFNGTLEPKVKGTQYLDALFPNNDLDFFIIFSSLSYVTGNVGQASYAAANGFMSSMAEGRRQRGLAGSVMHLAGIYGIGYVTRREANLLDRLEKMGYSNISEWDYLQYFAQAVLAGKPDNGSDGIWEFTSGIKPVNSDNDNPPPWIDVPRFSWYRRVRSKNNDGADGEKVSVRDNIKEQTTMDGVKAALLEGFVANLYKLLQMRPEDGAISPSTPMIELGIDSLVAVDMRVWFTRELDLDLPVLKLLGGATVEDMVEDAVTRLAPELIPNVKGSAAASKPEEGSKPEGDSKEVSTEQASSEQGESQGTSAEDSEESRSLVSDPLTTPEVSDHEDKE
ncbi:polyketide synthase [Penicillium angulare]|uniref:polyketide synthase n=1 Tax=Penicillium angulare TaxID=116970 RepID=UPI002540F22C|nr:polyketide synthase [Penicillium angulare]KAJ5281819.1 polyketide synthase [Penicillium angulare]